MTVKALEIIKKIKFIEKKEIVIIVLSLNAKNFVIYIITLKIEVKILVDLLSKIIIL